MQIQRHPQQPHRSVYIGKPGTSNANLWERCMALAQRKRRTMSSVLIELLAKWESENQE